MPISSYNPDGTVDIYNKKTGEIRRGIKPEELGSISPNLVADYSQGQTPGARLERETAEKGLLELNIPAEEKDPLAPQKKVARKALGILKKRFGRGESENVGTKKDLSLAEEGGILSRVRGKGRVAVSGLTSGELQQQVNAYRKSLDTFRGVFTQAFGSGTPQEAEAKALIEAAPGSGSTDFEAKAWFNDVNTLLSGKGVSETDEAVTEATKEGGGIRQNPIINSFLGDAIDFAQDVGVGLAMGGKSGKELQQSQNQAMSQANKAFDDALATDDPEQQERLFQVAEDALTQVGISSQNIQELYSQSVEEPTLGRGIKVGLEVSSLVGIPSAAKSAVDFVRGVGGKAVETGAKTVAEEAIEQTTRGGLKKGAVALGEKIENIMPGRILRKAQEEAAKKIAAKVPNEKILEAGEKMVEKIPALEPTMAEYRPLIEGTNTVEDLLETLDFLGDAYTQTQKVKSGLSPRLLKEMYEASIKVLKDVAPEVYENRALLRMSIKLPKTAARWLWRATLGRVLVR